MSSRPTNVLLVTAWSPLEPAGGVNQMVRILAKQLGAERSVHILVNEWDARRLLYSGADGLSIHSLRLRCPPGERPWLKGLLGWLWDFPSTIVQLRRLVVKSRIDIVHLHFANTYQYYFTILSIVFGTPYVLTFHGSDIVHFNERPKLDRLLARWVVARAAKVTAVSKSLANEASTVFPELANIEVVYNGLDFTELQAPEQAAAASDLLIDLPASFILMVSNVTYNKGPDLAVRAWSEIKETLPDLHLVIVGERRDLWQPCEELIRDLGCEDRVHMLGPLRRPQVFALMKQARALLFPSRSEGLGLVLLEAGAHGLPVICSDIPPFREIVEPERSALVVPLEDPRAIAQAARRLISESGLGKRLAEALHDRVMADFSGEAMADRYLQIYADVLARRHKTQI